MDDYQIIESLTDHHHIASRVDEEAVSPKRFYLLTFSPLPIPITSEIQKRIDILLFLKERKVIHLHDAFYVSHEVEEMETDDSTNIIQSHFVTVEELEPNLISLRHYLFNMDEEPIPNGFIRYVLRETMKCIIHLHALHHSYGMLSPLQILIPTDILENENYSKFDYTTMKNSVKLRPFSITIRREKPNYRSREKVLDPYSFKVSPNGEFSMMEFNERPIWYAPPEEIIPSPSQMVNPRFNSSPSTTTTPKESETSVEGDIWMFGCIMAELLLPFPIFSANELKDQIRNTLQLLGPPKSRPKLDPSKVEHSSFSSTTVTENIKKSGDSKVTRDYRIMNIVKLLRVSRNDLYDVNFSAIQIMIWLLEYEPSKRPDVSVLMDLPIFSNRYNIPFYKLRTPSEIIEYKKHANKEKNKKTMKKKLHSTLVSPQLKRRLKDVEKSIEDSINFGDDPTLHLLEESEKSSTKTKFQNKPTMEERKKMGTTNNNSIREKIERKLNRLEKESLMLVSMLNDHSIQNNDDETNNFFLPRNEEEEEEPSILTTSDDENDDDNNKKFPKKKKNVTATSLLEEFDESDLFNKKEKPNGMYFSRHDVDKLLAKQRKEFELSIQQLLSSKRQVKSPDPKNTSTDTTVVAIPNDKMYEEMKESIDENDDNIKTIIVSSNSSRKSSQHSQKQNKQQQQQQFINDIPPKEEEEEEEDVKTYDFGYAGDDEDDREEEEVMTSARTSFMSTSSPPLPRRETPTPSTINKQQSRRINRIYKQSMYTPTEDFSHNNNNRDHNLFELKIQVLGGLKMMMNASQRRRSRRRSGHNNNNKKKKKRLKKNIIITYSWVGSSIQNYQKRRMTVQENRMKCRIIRGRIIKKQIRQRRKNYQKNEEEEEEEQETSKIIDDGFLVWTLKYRTEKEEENFRSPVILNIWEKKKKRKKKRKKKNRKNIRFQQKLLVNDVVDDDDRYEIKFLGRCEVDVFLLSLYEEKFKFSGWCMVYKNNSNSNNGMTSNNNKTHRSRGGKEDQIVGKIKVVCGIRRFQKSASVEDRKSFLFHEQSLPSQQQQQQQKFLQNSSNDDDDQKNNSSSSSIFSNAYRSFHPTPKLLSHPKKEGKDVFMEKKVLDDDDDDDEKEGAIIESLRNIRKQLRQFQVN